MTETEIELDEHLKSLFGQLRMVPALSQQAVAEERAKYLAQGEVYRAAVSPQPGRRHMGWINTIYLAFQRKERNPMFYTLTAIVVTLALLFGGAGATVSAAQSSLPDEPLYTLKIWSEGARLSLGSSLQARLELTLGFTNRRVAEIAGLQANGRPLPGGVATRMQEELDAALQIAAGMDDAQTVQALEQVRLQAETQAQTMASLIKTASAQDKPTLARLQLRLQEQVRLAEIGEADPQGYRQQLRPQVQNRWNTPSQPPTAIQADTSLEMPVVTPDPAGNSYGPGPGAGQPAGTLGQFGPGEPNPSQTPAPDGGGYGPGPGADQPAATPGGYGPGPLAATCTPVRDGDGPISGPNSSQTPQSSGPGPEANNPAETQQPGSPEPGSGQTAEPPGQGGQP